MKHLAKIQAEFIKEARQWESMSRQQQKEYLSRHPKSKRKLTSSNERREGKLIFDKKHKQVSLKKLLKEKIVPVSNVDDVDDVISEFSKKYDSAAEIWMSDEKKEELHEMIKSGKYKFNSDIKDADYFEDEYDVKQYIKKRKDKGWSLFDNDENMDQQEYIFYKKK